MRRQCPGIVRPGQDGRFARLTPPQTCLQWIHLLSPSRFAHGRVPLERAPAVVLPVPGGQGEINADLSSHQHRCPTLRQPHSPCRPPGIQCAKEAGSRLADRRGVRVRTRSRRRGRRRRRRAGGAGRRRRSGNARGVRRRTRSPRCRRPGAPDRATRRGERCTGRGGGRVQHTAERAALVLDVEVFHCMRIQLVKGDVCRAPAGDHRPRAGRSGARPAVSGAVGGRRPAVGRIRI